MIVFFKKQDCSCRHACRPLYHIHYLGTTCKPLHASVDIFFTVMSICKSQGLELKSQGFSRKHCDTSSFRSPRG